MPKIKLFNSKPYLFLLGAFFLSSCLSVYPSYQKVKCDQLKDPIQTIKRLFADSKHHIKFSEINEKGIYLAQGKLIVFTAIKKALIQTKVSLFSRNRYFLRVYYTDNTQLMFETKDVELAVESYSVFECLAGIK